jgi:heme exporter protein D
MKEKREQRLRKADKDKSCTVLQYSALLAAMLHCCARQARNCTSWEIAEGK